MFGRNIEGLLEKINDKGFDAFLRGDLQSLALYGTTENARVNRSINERVEAMYKKGIKEHSVFMEEKKKVN